MFKGGLLCLKKFSRVAPGKILIFKRGLVISIVYVVCMSLRDEVHSRCGLRGGGGRG